MSTQATLQPTELKLKQCDFQALFSVDGLRQLDQNFLAHLTNSDFTLTNQLKNYRQQGAHWTAQQTSDFIINCAPIVDQFIAQLFQIEPEVAELTAEIRSHDPIFQFKNYYVQTHAKRMAKKITDTDSFNTINQWLEQQIGCAEDKELAVATLGMSFLQNPEQYSVEINKLITWCVLAQKTRNGQLIIHNWQSFNLPKKRDYDNLVPTESVVDDPFARVAGLQKTQRKRDGFQLTDHRMNERAVLNEIDYCVYCHKNEGDFCSKGFPVKKQEPELGLKTNPVGETLTGCPLEEKISEMHTLKKSGFSIGALATIMIDNPMCAVTGHRICNDCMKACIYQKQDPVNIPEIETRVLTDVLHLPWGVEIYDLLMRWNPLRHTQYLPKPYNGTKVLVMGMGPAGFTLAHHLLMEGCAVVGADGLKLEPLARTSLEKPIRSFELLKESLDNRVIAGFGGVAEYGITVRWDKNFLKLIYISLLRRQLFQIFGGVRFGGTITVEKAWELGFDHLAIAVGAGLPRELHIPNSLAPGMRQANDFLMALQLTGAVKKSSIVNLQVRLPAVIIGGGLTGIDTATEVQAYYITQIEKTHQRYHLLKAQVDETVLRTQFDTQSLTILDEFLLHAEAVLEERIKARAEKRAPYFTPLIRSWGGVTVVYRKRMQDSPAYKANHEEIIKALEEGIYYAENLSPTGVLLDEYGDVNALTCERANGIEETLPAKSIFVATGAKPNIAYAFEHRGIFEKNGMEYQRHECIDEKLTAVNNVGHIKSTPLGIFTSYEKDAHRVSFIGDAHPIFHGSVVKAIASANLSYPTIMENLKSKTGRGDIAEYQDFREKLGKLFDAHVLRVQRQAHNIVEITVHAPLAAAQWQPGQFYRLQNYETFSKRIHDTQLQMEAIATLGIKEDVHTKQLTFLIQETTASTKLVNQLCVGEPIALMGPTGAKIKIPDSPQDYLIMGDQLAIIYLLSVGPALKAAGCRLYFVGQLSNKNDRFYEEHIATLAEKVIWCEATENVITILQTHLPLHSIKTIAVIGSAALLKTMQCARKNILRDVLHPEVQFIGSVYGSMQCMLKGVCAQCLQWQIDPETGKRTKAVYACSWQHQPIQLIDTNHIDERLGQNNMQQILTNLWLNYMTTQMGTDFSHV